VVQISLGGVPIDSAVSVVVVSFETGQHIMFYWPDGNFNPSIPTKPGSSIVMAATVSLLTASCLTTWTTSSDSGYSYLTSKHMVGKYLTTKYNFVLLFYYVVYIVQTTIRVEFAVNNFFILYK